MTASSKSALFSVKAIERKEACTWSFEGVYMFSYLWGDQYQLDAQVNEKFAYILDNIIKWFNMQYSK